MKPLRTLIAWLLVATPSLAGITYHGTTAQTLYVRVQTATSTFIARAMVEGTSGGLGVYEVTDAQLVTAGLPAIGGPSLYNFTIRSGAASATANDPIVASGSIGWQDGVELPLLAPKNFGFLSINGDGSAATSNLGLLPRMVLPAPASVFSTTIFVRAPSGAGGLDGTGAGDGYASLADAISEINANRAGNPATYKWVKIDYAGPAPTTANNYILPSQVYLSGDGSTDRGGTSSLTSSNTASSILTVEPGGQNVIIRGLKVIGTSTTTIQAPIGFRGAGTSSRNVWVENVDIQNDSDGAYFSDSNGGNGWWTFNKCTFNFKWDGSTITDENSGMLADYVDCTWTQTGTSTVTSTNDARGATGLGGTTRLWNPTITTTTHPAGSNSSNISGGAAKAYPIAVRGTAKIIVIGGTITGPAAQPTDGYDIGQIDRGRVIVTATPRTGSNTGNLAEIEPGLDWSKLRNKTTTNALPNTTISSSQQVAGGGGGGTVSPFLVDDDHTWTFDSRTQITSPDILAESIGEPTIYKAVDFSEPLTANGSIQSVTSVTVADVSGSTEPLITTSAVSADKKKVHLTLDATLATAATYTFTVRILTTDSRTFIRKVKLQLQ